MIVVRIWEGLGNQLFQYAYARSLQLRTSVPVYLDVRHNNKGDLPFEKKDVVRRKLGLGHFQISMKAVKTDRIPSLCCMDRDGGTDRFRYLVLKKGLCKWKFISDEAIKYDVDPAFFAPRNHTYVNAHCVNKGYYESCREILLQELQLRNELTLPAELDKAFKDRNTVSIHIRLTDYLMNPSVICRQFYYNEAVRYICERVHAPYFIIFTDDREAAEKRYRFPGDTYWISGNGYKDYEELALMSRCRHNIIARSTFSYWGAWLNQNPEKIIVAPRPLFGGGLYEKGWKVL